MCDNLYMKKTNNRDPRNFCHLDAAGQVLYHLSQPYCQIGCQIIRVAGTVTVYHTLMGNFGGLTTLARIIRTVDPYDGAYIKIDIQNWWGPHITPMCDRIMAPGEFDLRGG